MAHSCSHLDFDDYPCLNKGTIQIGSHWYCPEHIGDASKDYNECDIFNDEAIDYVGTLPSDED